MERQLWLALYSLVTSLPSLAEARPPGARYRDAWVFLVHAWAVVHERPACWACREENWPADLLAGRGLPSAPTLSRRMRGGAGELAEKAWRALLGQLLPPSPSPSPSPQCCEEVRWIDSRPLRVPGRSVDPDASRGFVPEGFSHGYRLHALVAPGRGAGDPAVVVAWEVHGMSRNDRWPAEALLGSAPAGVTVVGDGQYDVDDLYVRAEARGCRWLARPRAGGRAKDGSRRSSPQRRAALERARTPEGRLLLRRRRRGIESVFARHAHTPGLLGPLPSWVRREARVRRWVATKILLDTLLVARKTRLTAKMQ